MDSTGIGHRAVLALGFVLVTLLVACGSAAEPSFDKALVALELGQYERAIEDLNEAIRLDPQYAKAYFNRGVIYERLGKSTEAERNFAKAKELGYER